MVAGLDGTASVDGRVGSLSTTPDQALFRRMAAVVHHGGVGTTSQGLRAGIPTLIVPFAFDQPDNAAHAERLGTSRTLHRRNYKRTNVAQELDKLLNNPQYALRAKVVGEQLRKERGAARAGDLIEEYLDRIPPRQKESRDLIYASGD